ncbi:hypothetical protein pb186bvf_001438 [Paramecium bursaria]
MNQIYEINDALKFYNNYIIITQIDFQIQIILPNKFLKQYINQKKIIYQEKFLIKFISLIHPIIYQLYQSDLWYQMVSLRSFVSIIQKMFANYDDQKNYDYLPIK